MNLYHGSNQQIEEIDLDRCRKYKDFGTGFYLTADYSRAVAMAQRRGAREGGSPSITAFLFYKNNCPPEIKIKEFKGYTAEWVRFVMDNRDRSLNPPYAHEYDIVIGPVADSRVDPVIDNYKQEFSGDIYNPANLSILASRLKYPGGYVQYCFCTEKAVNQLIRN